MSWTSERYLIFVPGGPCETRISTASMRRASLIVPAMPLSSCHGSQPLSCAKARYWMWTSWTGSGVGVGVGVGVASRATIGR
jgi:hypothetical protein